jgi:plasmid maintenance system killer protein
MYRRLPKEIREKARDTYRIWQKHPNTPGLNFEKLNAPLPLYSIRITQKYRAIAIYQDSVYVWVFIGTHAEYDSWLRE